ncbi:hypothetical protein BDZ91DRAFT_767945 [Kalaharituber pfeilii]|nr:hypothetical protein BDZ91DRAFT_767945 [Kalaharituber pfeilii]
MPRFLRASHRNYVHSGEYLAARAFCERLLLEEVARDECQIWMGIPSVRKAPSWSYGMTNDRGLHRLRSGSAICGMALHIAGDPELKLQPICPRLFCVLCDTTSASEYHAITAHGTTGTFTLRLAFSVQHSLEGESLPCIFRIGTLTRAKPHSLSLSLLFLPLQPTTLPPPPPPLP